MVKKFMSQKNSNNLLPLFNNQKGKTIAPLFSSNFSFSYILVSHLISNN